MRTEIPSRSEQVRKSRDPRGPSGDWGEGGRRVAGRNILYIYKKKKNKIGGCGLSLPASLLIHIRTHMAAFKSSWEPSVG